jgi:formylglycine-generating enzyme required for sulfatase activity
LRVSNTISIGGAFTQDVSSEVGAGTVTLTGCSNPPGYPYSGQYQLSGGRLTASNLTVSFSASFSQSGGQLLISNLQLLGGSFSQSGGAVTQSGVLTLAGATWSAAGEQHFGQLQLSGSSNSASVLNLPLAACALRLAGSSSLIWSNTAVLKIENWRGSASGGGQHQIIFGSDGAALTWQQISRIQFHNPGGSGKTFPAMILANGEIVPSQWLSSQPNGSALILQWGGGFTLQSATNVGGTYQDVSGAISPYTNQFSEPQRFFRLRKSSGMALIPAGSFTMGDALVGDGFVLPLHTVYVSAFYMDKYDVTKSLWDTVYQWAISHGYAFDYSGSGKAPNHPVQTIDWYDCVKWCNARSQMEGRTPAYYTNTGLTAVYRTGQVAPYVNWNSGYRLPTEAEWEKAARGGASGQRFPWGNTISWSQANYFALPLSAGGYAYDINPTSGYDPAFNDAVYPYTSPVGYFAPNGYGLYDMAGNVWQWCWDWYGSYSTGSQSDPRGPASGSDRVFRGGGWNGIPIYCRSAFPISVEPTRRAFIIGFRSVLPPGQ